MKTHGSIVGRWSFLVLVVLGLTSVFPMSGAGVVRRGARPANAGITPVDTVGFMVPGIPVSEGDSAVSVTVTRIGVGTGTASVHVVSVPGTASTGSDFPAIDTFLVFPPGIFTRTVFVGAVGDLKTEGPESYSLQLLDPIGCHIGFGSTTVFISDTSTTPIVIPVPDVFRFDPAGPIGIDEGAAPNLVSVVRDGPATNSASVEVVFDAGSATPGLDFPPTDVVLLFPPGVTSQPVALGAIADFLTEGSEGFVVRLANPIGAQIGNGLLSVQINDTSLNPTNLPPADVLGFATPGISIDEGALPTMVNVVRVGPATNSASVTVAFVPGSATPGLDYPATTLALLFAPGVLSQSVPVSAFADLLTEGPEQFSAQLSNVVGAQIGNGLLSVQINDTSLNITNHTADLELAATLVPPGPALVGDTASLGITVLNRGPDAAANVSVRAALPAGWSLVALPPLPFPQTYDPSTGLWFLGQLFPGETRVLALPLRADAPGESTVPIEIVGSSLPDPDSVPNNGNAAEDDIGFVFFKVPDPSADLRVLKTSSVATSEITGKVTFEIVVENLGPDDAKDIKVTDTLPVGLDIDSVAEPFGTTFVKATGIWSVPKLANGAKETLKVVVKTATGGGSYTNRVAITAAAPKDPVAANNKAEAAVVYVGYTACGVATVCNEGTPLYNANALVTLEKGPLKLNLRTGPQGGFCFSNLVAGDYKVTIVAADPASGILPFTDTITVDATPSPNLFEAKRRLIVGRVTFGPGGTGIAGVTVEAVGGGKTISAKTDAQGNYRFEKLDEIEYTVAPKAPDAGAYKPAKVVVDFTGFPLPCPGRADFDLQGTLSISGRLNACAANGFIIPNATLTLNVDGEKTGRTTKAGLDGKYIFANLPPGKYVVTPTSPAFTFAPLSKDITLKKDNVAANFIGNPGNIIAGRVMGANKAAFPGVSVDLFLGNAALPTATVTTDADGEFKFAAQANGIWAVIPKPPEAGIVFNPARFVITLGGPNPTCVTYPVFIANRNAVELVALELNQVVQDWQNSVPLVANKSTVIRAHLKPAGTNKTSVSVGDVRLVVERDGKLVTRLQPLKQPILVRPDYDADKVRTNWEHSFNFVLDAADAKGEMTFTLEWTRGLLTTYRDPQGKQTAVRNNATTAKFEAVKPIKLRWVEVTWSLGGKDHTPSKAQLQEQLVRLRAGLPTPNLPSPAGADLTSVTWGIPKGMDPGDLLNTPEDVEKLRASLQRAIQKKRADELLGGRDPTIYYGVLVDTVITGQAGGIGGTTAFGDITQEPDRDRNLPTHEIGHVLGRHHDVHTAFGIKFEKGTPLKQGLCNEVAQIVAPDYPMDVSPHGALSPTMGPMREGPFKLAYGWERSMRRVVSPFQTADVMSYCKWDTEWVWPGIPSYRGMFDAVKAKFGAAKAALQSDGTVAVIRASGMLGAAGELIEFDPIRPLDLASLPPTPDPGAFGLRLLDGLGVVLSDTSFDPLDLEPEDGDSQPPRFRAFDLVVARPDSLAAIELWNGATLLKRVVITAHFPQLSVVGPTGTVDVGADPIVVEWTASDADGDALLYAVEASVDGGATWDELATDLSGTTFRVAPGTLPAGHALRLRVRASDGYHEASADVPAEFYRGNQSPTLSVGSPGADTLFAYGETIRFEAVSSDPEDGDVPDERLEWRSDIHGVLGKGATLEVPADTLEPGHHVVTVRATDSEGAFTESSVAIDVTTHRVHPMRIVALADGVEVWWPADTAGLRLEAAEEFDGDGWYPVDAEPELDGDWFHARLPVGDEPLFFRLSDPSTP